MLSKHQQVSGKSLAAASAAVSLGELRLQRIDQLLNGNNFIYPVGV
jgi:hypothetical protein